MTTSPTQSGQQSEIRAEVLALVQKNATDGITANDVYEQLGATDKTKNKEKIQSIDKALITLKKDGLITQSEERGPYFPTASS